MKNNDFISKTKEHFDRVSSETLSDLKSGEDLILNLDAEDSLYARLNGNRVRQNTNVEQTILSMKFLADGRTVEQAFQLSGEREHDMKTISRALATLREHAKALPVDPHQVPAENNGTSTSEFRGAIPDMNEIVGSVVGSGGDLDLAGLYCGGPVINANRNSKGQSHWFATESFFMDYSIYDGPKAAKSVYAGSKWVQGEWEKNLARTGQQLKLLGRETQNIKPGKYRTYLAPGAVNELAAMFGWGGLSGSAWKQGQSALKRLADGEAKLSPLFNMRENFQLGLTPRFNSSGEVSPELLPLIEEGELKNMLVSSRSAKEFGLPCNYAADHESPRSMEILAGALEEKDVVKELGTGLYLSNLHYLNWSDRVSARITGMTRYACFWVERGEIVGPIKDLRFDESLLEALGTKLMALTSNAVIDPATQTYGLRALGGSRIPGMMIDDFTFTL